jgi:glutamate 5-kinase
LAELVTEKQANDETLDGLVSESSGTLDRGGTVAKLQAARIAVSSGAVQ